MQASALVRQLRVMWGVGVGVTLEVLVAPECRHGAALATTLDTTTAPSQNLRLIEQWNFTIYDRRYIRARTLRVGTVLKEVSGIHNFHSVIHCITSEAPCLTELLLHFGRTCI